MHHESLVLLNGLLIESRVRDKATHYYSPVKIPHRPRLSRSDTSRGRQMVCAPAIDCYHQGFDQVPMMPKGAIIPDETHISEAAMAKFSRDNPDVKFQSPVISRWHPEKYGRSATGRDTNFAQRRGAIAVAIEGQDGGRSSAASYAGTSSYLRRHRSAWVLIDQFTLFVFVVKRYAIRSMT